jgi:hypothetical protein
MLPTQHGTPCAGLAGVFWIIPRTAPMSPRVWATEEDSEGQAVREAVELWFIQQPVSFFAEGISKLVQRWDKCLNSGGQYL